MKRMGNCGGVTNRNSDFNHISCDFPISAGDGVDDDGGGESCVIGGGGGGRVVLVGVNLDGRSKELLTWALVKVAQSGDRVIALHVIDPNNRDRATALSVMNSFDDSLLASYEGLCKLKQVDLKLKVSRGTPVHKVLAQEATSYGAMSLIVGTSATCKSRRSSTSVARHCAKDVSRDTTVIAVCNGKVTFRRDSSRCSTEFLGSDGVDSPVKQRKSSSKSPSLPASSTSGTSEESGLQSSLSSGTEVNNSMGMWPANSKEILANKPGWQRVRKLLLQNGKLFNQSSSKKPSVMQWALRSPGLQSISAICPDQEQSADDDNENNQSSSLDTDKRAGGLPQTSVSVIPHSSDSGVQTLPKELEGLSQKFASRYRLFSYQELLSSTSNFSPEHMIGKGGSSKVYRGIFQDGKELAVKILKPSADASKQFVTEIELLSNLDHKNIISLLGFHFKDNQVLLIYDHLSRGSLEDNLHGHKKSGNVFGWKQRYKVALGIADALEHLHNGVAEPIIHRDVKSSNILLSDDFDPKLSDFGLAMLASGSSRHIESTGVTGTLGYLAPEYFMNGKVTDKIDVYSYGVVLLELLSGRKPIDDVYPKGLGNLVTWAKPILKEGRFRELIDPALVDSYDHDQVEKMALAASLCARRAPEFRPQITRIVQLLHGNTDTIEWARQQVNTLDEVDAVEGEQSASNIQSFINLAFLNLEDDSHSNSSSEQNFLVEDHLRGRCSRSSSSEHGCSAADKW